jgi:hypothetical protein
MDLPLSDFATYKRSLSQVLDSINGPAAHSLPDLEAAHAAMESHVVRTQDPIGKMILDRLGAALVCAAAEAGDVELLADMRAAGNPAANDADIVRAAAGRGQLRTLRWVRTGLPGKAWTPDLGGVVCAAAASGNQTHLLAALHPYWSASTCAAAARSGSVEALTMLLDMGCPWDARDAPEAAMRSGHPELLGLLWARSGESRRAAWDFPGLLALAEELGAPTEWIRRASAS